jgi:hypothetical protein
MSNPQLTDIEAAAVRSWPALETGDIDRWLWRYTSGGSFRANAASARSPGPLRSIGRLNELSGHCRSRSPTQVCG